MSTTTSSFDSLLPTTGYLATVVVDEFVSADLIRQRQEQGIDHHDEVWEGVYMMSPIGDDEHQRIIHRFELALGMVLTWSGRAEIRPGINLSDRIENWTNNFRVPDIAVYLSSTRAECFGPFWNGGPDFAVEVVSKKDRTREKFDFYAKVGTRELLIVDRDPWQLELFRLVDGKLISIATSTIGNGQTLASDVIPFTFKLEAGETRPQIQVGHTESDQSWQV